MSPTDVLLELVEVGAVLWTDGRTLRYRAPFGSLGEDLRARAATARSAVIALVRSGAVLPRSLAEWPEPACEAYEERAGMMQFAGGLPREDAEREAERLVRVEHARAFVARAALVVEPPPGLSRSGRGRPAPVAHRAPPPGMGSAGE